MKKIIDYLNLFIFIVLIIVFMFGKFGIYIDEKEYYYEYYTYSVDNNYLRLISLFLIFASIFFTLTKLFIFKDNNYLIKISYLVYLITIFMSILSSITTIIKHGYYESICYLIILLSLLILSLNIYKLISERKKI